MKVQMVVAETGAYHMPAEVEGLYFPVKTSDAADIVNEPVFYCQGQARHRTVCCKD